MIQEFPSLAFFSVVDKAFLLVFRKLLEPFRSGHSLQSAQPIRSGSKCGVLSECVNEYLDAVNILFSGVLLVRIGVQEKEQTIGFSLLGWFLPNLCDVK